MFDVEEFLSGIQLSLECVPSDNKESLKRKIGEDISRVFAGNLVVTNILEKRYRNAEKYQYHNNLSSLIGALDLASTLNPGTELNILKAIISIYPYESGYYHIFKGCIRKGYTKKSRKQKI